MTDTFRMPSAQDPRSRRGHRVANLLTMLGLVLVVVSVFLFATGNRWASAAEQQHYRDLALRTQRYTWEHLAYLSLAPDCVSAPYVTYRRDSINTTISDHWYVALQLRADAALVRLGDDRFRCQVDKTVTWMEWLWDPGHRGFAPRADLDGSNPTLQDVYADDNAIIGIAFLEAARLARDPAVRARALDGATRAAGYLSDTGLWDDTFGGGLWWNNQRHATVEGKPAQATALMAYLMAELYAETGRPQYRDRAIEALNWLDRVLFDERLGLYAYSVNGSDADPGAVTVSNRYFCYDQAIVVQALLALHRAEPDAGYLARAQALGRAADRAFWQPELGAYSLEMGGVDVWVPYAAWVAEALLDLYAVDHDPYWRSRARAATDALHRTFAAAESGRYGMMVFPCNAEGAPFCLPGERWGLDTNVYTMSQAQMQRLMARLAAVY